MPGYLSNRRIAFLPPQASDMAAEDLILQEQIVILQEQIDDLSLNLGV